MSFTISIMHECFFYLYYTLYYVNPFVFQIFWFSFPILSYRFILPYQSNNYFFLKIRIKFNNYYYYFFNNYYFLLIKDEGNGFSRPIKVTLWDNCLDQIYFIKDFDFFSMNLTWLAKILHNIYKDWSSNLRHFIYSF